MSKIQVKIYEHPVNGFYAAIPGDLRKWSLSGGLQEEGGTYYATRQNLVHALHRKGLEIINEPQ